MNKFNLSSHQPCNKGDLILTLNMKNLILKIPALQSHNLLPEQVSWRENQDSGDYKSPQWSTPY